MALGTDYIVRYLSDISGAVKGAKELETVNASIAKNIQAQYGQATKIIGQIPESIKTIPIKIDGQDMIKTLSTVGQVVQTTNGSFLEMTKTTSIIPGQMAKVTTSVKDVTSQFVKGNLETEKGNKIFTNFTDNIKQLAGRALLTIPIWMALRGVMMGVTSAISDSFNNLVTVSLALQKAKQNLQGTVEEISTQFNQLKTDTRSLALETGVSQDKIIAAFQKFATVGFDYQTSMAGANNATKLAIILQGDVTETANAFARSMRVLIDTSKDAKPQSEQLADAMSLTLELWRTNAFEIGELTQSLEKFAGTAKTMNFTTAQTIALLSTLGTAGLRGSQAGTLLRASMGKLVENLDLLSSTVGVKFNKNLDSAYDVLLRVIEQIKILSETSKLAPEATEAISEIFGGIRGAQPIRALIALREELLKNIAIVPNINKFNESFKETEGVLGNVVKRYHTANAEIGKGFLTGLTGAEEFNGALEKIVVTLNKMGENAEVWGKSIRGAFDIPQGMDTLLKATPLNIQAQLDPGFTTAIQDQIVKALHGNLPKIDLAVLFSTLLEAQTLKINLGLPESDINNALTSIRRQLLDMRVLTEDTTKEVEKQAIAEQKTNNILLKKKDLLKLEDYARKQMNALGLSEVEIETRLLSIKEANNRYNENDIELQKELVTHLQTMENIQLTMTKNRGLVDNQLEILKLQGATNRQLVEQRIELERMYNINQTREDLLRNELDLQKEITKEKFNQNELSSDTMKLFEISQKYGRQAAFKVSEFLSGKTPVQYLPNNKELFDIIQEFFASQLKQLQASEFFFKGLGTDIPIPERRAIDEFRPLPVSAISIPSIKTDIGNINIEVKKLLKAEDMAKQIMESLIEAIQNNPTIENAINEKIDEF